jgi:pSer/pThr/pTyr-binding forkhead associated (FHA) protein
VWRLFVDGRPAAYGTLARLGQTHHADQADEGAQAVLTVVIEPSARQVVLAGSNEYVLGRLDATRGVFPDIDLTPDGGLDGGVSRRHARIHKQRTQFFIEDLGSANGTFLNGQRLTPYLPHPLRDKDEIQLGRIRLQIQLQA